LKKVEDKMGRKTSKIVLDMTKTGPVLGGLFHERNVLVAQAIVLEGAQPGVRHHVLSVPSAKQKVTIDEFNSHLKNLSYECIDVGRTKRHAYGRDMDINHNGGESHLYVYKR